MCLDFVFWERGVEYQVKERFALIPNMMYPPMPKLGFSRIQVTQQPKEDNIKGKLRKSGHIK